MELDGINLVYDTGIKSHLDGKIVDYRTGPAGDGFTITDENPTRTCGDCSC